MFGRKKTKSASGGQSGSFRVNQKGYRKTVQKFAAALTAVVFVLGAGLAVIQHFKKLGKTTKSQTVAIEEIPGWWQQQYFGSSVCGTENCKSETDPDQDGLTNTQEFFYHTDPLNAHTIRDELDDGQLVAAGFDPSRSGRMTFEQVVHPDNILGESLLLDVDIKQMVAEDMDISKIKLPLVEDDQLRIIKNPSEDDYKKYAEAVKILTDRYFPEESLDINAAILKTPNTDVSSIMTKANIVSIELKKIPVPDTFLMFHKYNIALYQLMSEVIDPKDQDSDVWYDKARAFFATYQKLNFEKQRLALSVRQ